MSLTISITVPPSAAPRQARAIADFLSDKTNLHKAAAKGAIVPIQSNFRRLSNTNRNKFGARGGFWNRMLSGTRAGWTAEKATVSVPREVALRYFGGTVSPKVAKYLTIPLRSEAYGKSPRQFQNIKFARIGGKLFAFTTDLGGSGRNEQTGARSFRAYRKAYKGRARITLLYLLVKSATIKGDKSVLPTDEQTGAAAVRGVEAALAGARARARQGGTQ